MAPDLMVSLSPPEVAVAVVLKLVPELSPIRYAPLLTTVLLTNVLVPALTIRMPPDRTVDTPVTVVLLPTRKTPPAETVTLVKTAEPAEGTALSTPPATTVTPDTTLFPAQV